jgi:hypothetical protein
MDKKITGLASAISSLALMQAADASPTKTVSEILNPRSYAELLQPIPNAGSLLKEIDAARAVAQANQSPNVRLAQYWYKSQRQSVPLNGYGAL